MTERGEDKTPFDERAALDELERFRADIERYRHQREDVAEDFEEFVRSFPSPVDVFPSEQAPPPAAAPAAGAPKPVVPSPAVPPPPAPAQVLRPAPIPPAPERARPAPEPPPGVQAVPVTPKPATTPLLLGGLLVLVLVGAFVGWTLNRRSAQLETPAPGVSEQAPPSPAPARPAPSAATPPAAAPAPAGSEIMTVRRAWVRLIADGERVVERELPADTRVPFEAEQTIVIRTGDAGAVRLSIRGEDQGPLGRDGEVVTRSFTLPAKPPR